MKFFEYIDNESLVDVHDAITNNTVSILTKMNESIISIEIDQTFVSSNQYFDKHLRRINGTNRWMVIDKPLETVSIYNYNKQYKNIVKCFTYFSQTNSDWSHVNLAFNYIKVYFKFDQITSPILTNRFPIILHSPNSLPDYRMFKYIQPGFDYLLVYSQWKIERLGHGYNTDCREYDPTQLTWNDCVYRCYQNSITNKYHNDGIVLVDLFLQMKDFKNKTLRKYKAEERTKRIIMFKCMGQCHNECHQSYFSFSSNILRYNSSFTNIIYIRHNEMPDLNIRHIPEMPLMTLICNFGGLLGMWLGVSFLTIFGELWNSIKKFANNRNPIYIRGIFLKNATLNLIKSKH